MGYTHVYDAMSRVPFLVNVLCIDRGGLSGDFHVGLCRRNYANTLYTYSRRYIPAEGLS